MRFRFTLLLILLCLSPKGFAASLDDLVRRENLFYKKFTDEPFTGELDKGLTRGSIKNGHFVGSHITYHDNGQLMMKGSFNKNGQMDGLWEVYHENGQLFSKGEYRNGKSEGYWESYLPDGTVMSTGTYRNGEKISD